MARPHPTPHILDLIGDLFPRVPHLDYAMHLDSCPECMARDNTPERTQRVPGGWQCHYVCRTCKGTWMTAWWEGEG